MRPFLFILFLLGAPDLFAQIQDVTLREINFIPQSDLEFLDAQDAELTEDDIQEFLTSPMIGDSVRFTAVVLSDPYNSGLANIFLDFPSRVHVFVRDVAAVDSGMAGMGMQLVDDEYFETGLSNASIGDVIEVTGVVNMFANTLQVLPDKVSLLGQYNELGYPDSLIEPVLVDIDDIVKAVGFEEGVQTNWLNLTDLRYQFVRLENIKVFENDLSIPDRPDFHLTESNGRIVLPFYDMSLRFRNDRDEYPEPFNKRLPEEGDFVPPGRGTFVDIQGFLFLKNFSDALDRAVPSNGLMDIVPFEDRGCVDEVSNFRCDFFIVDDLIPVELTSFEGVHNKGRVYLQWDYSIRGEQCRI